MKRLIPVIFILALTLTGCATPYDVDINSSYDAALKNHDVQQTIQVGNKARSIKELMLYDCSEDTEACGVAKAMSSTMAAFYISQIKPEPFNQARPTTGADVQDKMAGFTGQLITGAVTFGVVREVAQNQPTTNYSNEGNVVNSGNRTDSHTTTVGDQNEGQSSAAGEDGGGSDIDGGQQDNSDNSDNSEVIEGSDE